MLRVISLLKEIHTFSCSAFRSQRQRWTQLSRLPILKVNSTHQRRRMYWNGIVEATCRGCPGWNLLSCGRVQCRMVWLQRFSSHPFVLLICSCAHCDFSSVEVVLSPLGSLGGALADGPLTYQSYRLHCNFSVLRRGLRRNTATLIQAQMHCNFSVSEERHSLLEKKATTSSLLEYRFNEFAKHDKILESSPNLSCQTIR
jgi:hypothetical protein